MGTDRVREFFKSRGLDYEVKEFEASTATVELAAAALGVSPGEIAKTMAFQLKEEPILIVAKGTARIDNRKFKDNFKQRAKMMSPEAVLEATGFPVGGVCPFDSTQIKVYLDVSLQEFDHVFPAAGTPNSTVKITPQALAEIVQGIWIDVSVQEANSQG
ncbi:MAG: YbaK/EbsC family protein [Bacillota bacterium]